MTINSNLFVLFMLLLMIVVGVVAWRLARRKSRHPGLVYLFTRTGLTASVLPGWDNLSSRCTP